MFSVERRAEVLAALVDAAQADDSIISAASVGSMARREVDRWSDIDLALELAPGAAVVDVLARWTVVMDGLGPVADHLDIQASGAVYRVFLLADALQVDLSFWEAGLFGSTGEAFELLFGEANSTSEALPADALVIARWGWLYALHARAALQRGRYWQALQMVDELRDQLIALACFRHGLPPSQGRGVDRLPDDERAGLAAAIAPYPEQQPLQDALNAGLTLLGLELQRLDRQLAERLAPVLAQLQQP